MLSTQQQMDLLFYRPTKIFVKRDGSLSADIFAA
jgi:hypothetical protein